MAFVSLAIQKDIPGKSLYRFKIQPKIKFIYIFCLITDSFKETNKHSG